MPRSDVRDLLLVGRLDLVRAADTGDHRCVGVIRGAFFFVRTGMRIVFEIFLELWFKSGVLAQLQKGVVSVLYVRDSPWHAGARKHLSRRGSLHVCRG